MPTLSTPPLDVRHTVLPDADVLALRGDLDIYTVLALREVALDPLACSAATLVLDLSDLDFLDSTGIGTMVAIRRSCVARGHELVLVVPEGWVLRVLGVGAAAERDPGRRHRGRGARHGLTRARASGRVISGARAGHLRA